LDPARIARFAATVWIVCDCGASMARRVDEDDTLAQRLTRPIVPAWTSGADVLWSERR
jgi:hypothetical protein